MSDQFKIVIASDGNHEKTFAEIYYLEKFVALINQEDGIGRFKIEFPAAGMDESLILRTVDFQGFQFALATAAKKLGAN